MSILRPGSTFREYADLALDIPEQYWVNQYFVSAHGCGLTGEYPYLYHRVYLPDAGYDGVIEPGMVLCRELYCQGGWHTRCQAGAASPHLAPRVFPSRAFFIPARFAFSAVRGFVNIF